MLSDNNHPFISFLKGHFKIGGFFVPDINPREEQGRHKRLVNSVSVLKNVLRMHIPRDGLDDIDDKAAHTWSKELDKHRLTPSRRKKHLPELSHFLKSEKRMTLGLHAVHPGTVPWSAKLATSVALALIMAISIARAAPEIGDAIIKTSDKLVAKPVITLSYLFAGEKTQAKLIEEQTKEIIETAKKKIPVDKNYLVSYILSHQDELKLNFEHQGSLVVSRDKLDGRVAGVSDTNILAKPSPALLDLSQGKDNSQEKASQLLIKEINDWLKMLEGKQIELSHVLAEKITK